MNQDMTEQHIKQGEIVMYQPDETIRLEVRLENDTVWLNRQQLAELFGRDVKTIGKHINNALKEELRKISTVAKFAIVQMEGGRKVARTIDMSQDMSTKYRCKKQVTRMMARCTQGVAKVYPRCSQALGILMSMARVWLEYAWSMARDCNATLRPLVREWLEYAYSMPAVCLETKNLFPYGEQNIPTLGTKHSQPGNKTGFLRPFSSKRAELERRLASDEITARFERHYGSSLTSLRLVMSLLLIVGGLFPCVMKAQITEGMYYIKIGDVYVWRAITEKTSGQPYLSGLKTTSYSDDDYSFGPAHCSWIVKPVTVNEGGIDKTYYTFINVGTNQYIVWDYYTSGTAKAVHLETRTNEPTQSSDKCFFKYELNDGKYYIHPDKCTTTNSGFNYKEEYKDDDKLRERTTNPGRGLIQFYNGTANAILSANLLPAPTISEVDDNNMVTITENNGLPAGYNIRYTLGDGTQADPTATTETYITNDGSATEIPITSSGTLKVVVERYGVVLTEVATKVINVVPLIPSPTITYNTNNLIEMATELEGASIYYTTDGTTPSVINGRRYQNPFDPADDVTEIKAIVIAPDGETSLVTTFTPPVLLGQNHIRLIQNQGNAWTCAEHLGGHFYMRPTSEENLSTTSLFFSGIQWYFLNAGDGYYYIIHDEKRLWCDGTNVKLKAFDSETPDQFKFRLVAYPETGTTTDYNIVPFGLTEGNMYVTKPNGNGEADVIALGNSNSEENARWKFILPSAFDHTAPFTVSNDNQSYFYKIVNNENYIIQSSETAVATSSSTDAEVVKTGSWMMMLVPDTEIGVGDDFTYYNIRNAKTNDYLYYNGGETPGFAVSATMTEGQEDKYRFTWARSTTTDTYYLIPRTQVVTAKSSLLDFPAYTITAAPGFILDPVLTMDDDGIVTMTCATNGSEIFYRIDGDYTDEEGANTETNPEIPAESGKKPTLPTRLYSTDFLLSLDATQVRAVAVLKNDHTVRSAVQLINLTQCGTPTPTDEDFHDAQGSLTLPKVEVKAATSEEPAVYADIYYTVDGTAPVLVETTPHGMEPEIVFKYNSRSKVWAVAAKNGMRKSEPYKMDVVYMPTITFQQESYTYSATINNGSIVSNAIEPTITKVQVEGETAPIDAADYYVIGYRDNKDAGTGKIIIKAKSTASFKLYGIGNFTINKAPISSVTVTPDPAEFTYNYRAQGPEITSIKATGGNGNIELLGFDAYYTVTDNLQVSAGEYTLRVEAKEGTNFTGYVEKLFTIKSKTLNADDIYITVKKEVNGNTVSYVPTLKDGSVTLVEDKDYTYTVDTTNGIVLTFTGKGNYSSLEADKRIYEFIDLPFVRPENSNSDYVAPYAASSDLTTPLGMNAYIVTGVTNKDRVILEEVTYIPKDVPVLLLSGKRADGFGKVLKTSDTYTTDELAEINAKNKLKVNTTAEPIEAAQIYLFYKGEFVLNAEGTLPAGKVYLDLRDTPNPTPAPRLYIVDGDSNTTEIEVVRYQKNNVQNDRWFTLDGRQLQDKPAQKGLYIKNGSKIVIR